MSPLVRRDEAYLIPKPVIVLLIMIGSGFLVCMGFAIHSAFGFGRNQNGIKPLSNEQQEYMAEVRTRNMDALAYEGAKGRRFR
ncbi:Nn.00g113710.m01.CDS01 [Neocucurbitaria sp. VM-36]